MQDNVPLHATALAHDTILSLAPLLLIAMAVARSVFGEEAARGEQVRQIQGLVDKEGAVAIQAKIENASRAGSGGVLASVVGFLLLLLGPRGCLVSCQWP
ncbi:YihY/virulence factor BrkB family protein [Cyanobium sp. AMD-g]|uniref:YhjD/YihY/BrkB family envelope integrity protein n=1 Tax=Cyanobium sp. AMD-g TaxID=2823699 RepID=UPI0020CD8D4D|nr:YhjD/YihY/BrkB family envelope integrity protein [Cyanobium sp. AMD-g]MCP9929706.1 YihY/virulence factor BrkB family protein [Cyanobium sp. AMD-g]